MRYILWLLFLYWLTASSCAGSRKIKQESSKQETSTAVSKVDTGSTSKLDSTGIKKAETVKVSEKKTVTEHTTEKGVDTTLYTKRDSSNFTAANPDSGEVREYKSGNVLVRIKGTSNPNLFDIEVVELPKAVSLNNKQKETWRQETNTKDSAAHKTSDSTRKQARDSNYYNRADSGHKAFKQYDGSKGKTSIGVPWYAWLILAIIIVIYIIICVARGNVPFAFIWGWMTRKKRHNPD